MKAKVILDIASVYATRHCHRGLKIRIRGKEGRWKENRGRERGRGGLREQEGRGRVDKYLPSSKSHHRNFINIC